MNCLAPVRLIPLMVEAQKSTNWMQSQCSLVGMPKDKKTRIMLGTLEMIYVFLDDYPKETIRFRLAFIKKGDFTEIVEQTVLEVYSLDGRLLHTYKIKDLSITQALALKAELMYAALDANGCYIKPN